MLKLFLGQRGQSGLEYLKHVCADPRAADLNMTLPSLSIGQGCKPAAHQCRYRSTGQTDGETDAVPLHRRSR